MADPNTLILRQGKTFRVVFTLTDASSNPVSLAGFGAIWRIFDKPGGNVLLLLTDTETGDVLDPGNAVPPVQVEAGGTGQVAVRIGADQTALISKSLTIAYDASIYAKDDPTGEIQPLAAGPLTVILPGADS